jgi:N-acyl-D-aspartate/D-glutamate deacylase
MAAMRHGVAVEGWCKSPAMPHDLVIRGGTIIDGTGRPGAMGDVAIDGDRLTQVGGRAGVARREINAGGLAVTPGVVDPHTHYDAQICWDQALTPSCWHGVTSVVMGNCGFTIAPCPPHGRARLMRMLERVEGMSLAALEAGITWEWETFPEYLDAIARRGSVLNVGGLVGHSALRYLVLDEAASERAATPAEVDAMRDVLRDALAAGALGFSTSQSPTHWGGDGKPVPSRSAADDEVTALASVMRERGRGTTEITCKALTDVEVSIAVARASGRPVTYLGASTPEGRAAVTKARAEGLRLVPQVSCRPALLDFRLDDGVVFDQLPSWRRVMESPREALPAIFRDPEFRARFRSDILTRAGGFPIFKGDWEHVKVTITGDPGLREHVGESVAALAEARNIDPVDAFLDFALGDGLATEFSYRMSSDLSRATSILGDEHLIGLSDAGAHLTLLADAAYTTYLLGRWVRERGMLPLERAVQKITQEPAQLFGLAGRGVLEAGAFADVVLLDATRVADRPAALVHDLPGGGPRLVARADGIEAVIVNGAVAVERGELTGARPGRVLRGE